MVAKVAASPASTVLLTGESGTGKDLVAKTIHYSSARASRPFMNITCSALPEQLLESELFGHERGAFTDARMQKRGLLESADGGTVFLDEIGEMVPGAPGQAAAVSRGEELQARRRRRRHPRRRPRRRGDEPQPRGAGRQGRVPQRSLLPPQRAADPPAGAARACRGRAGAGELLHRRVQRGVQEAHHRREPGGGRRCCKAYGWPGNVRELRNVVERAMLLAEGTRLEAHDFGALKAGARVRGSVRPAGGRRQPRGARTQPGRRRRCGAPGGNQTKAAALLGLNRDQIRYRIEKFGLSVTPRSRMPPDESDPAPRADCATRWISPRSSR